MALKKIFCTRSSHKIYLIPYTLQFSCDLNWFRHFLQNCQWPVEVNGILFLSWSSSLRPGEKEQMRLGFCSQLITRCTAEVPAAGTDIPSNSIWVGCATFEGRVYGCGCEVACGHLQPCPSPVPRDPAASPAASPSLVTASVFCLLTLSWRSPSAGWWMGVSLSLGCSMQPGGLVTSEFLVVFFSTGGGEWLHLHFL